MHKRHICRKCERRARFPSSPRREHYNGTKTRRRRYKNEKQNEAKTQTKIPHKFRCKNNKQNFSKSSSEISEQANTPHATARLMGENPRNERCSEQPRQLTTSPEQEHLGECRGTTQHSPTPLLIRPGAGASSAQQPCTPTGTGSGKTVLPRRQPCHLCRNLIPSTKKPPLLTGKSQDCRKQDQCANPTLPPPSTQGRGPSELYDTGQQQKKGEKNLFWSRPDQRGSVSWASFHKQKEMSWVRSPVRAHARTAAQVPSWGCTRVDVPHSHRRFSPALSPPFTCRQQTKSFLKSGKSANLTKGIRDLGTGKGATLLKPSQRKSGVPRRHGWGRPVWVRATGVAVFLLGEGLAFSL